MQYNTVKICKQKFIQHTNKYLKLALEGKPLIITNKGKPAFRIKRIAEKTIDDLKGIIPYVHVKGDINESIFPELK